MSCSTGGHRQKAGPPAAPCRGPQRTLSSKPGWAPTALVDHRKSRLERRGESAGRGRCAGLQLIHCPRAGSPTETGPGTRNIAEGAAVAPRARCRCAGSPPGRSRRSAAAASTGAEPTQEIVLAAGLVLTKRCSAGAIGHHRGAVHGARQFCCRARSTPHQQAGVCTRFHSRRQCSGSKPFGGSGSPARLKPPSAPADGPQPAALLLSWLVGRDRPESDALRNDPASQAVGSPAHHGAAGHAPAAQWTKLPSNKARASPGEATRSRWFPIAGGNPAMSRGREHRLTLWSGRGRRPRGTRANSPGRADHQPPPQGQGRNQAPPGTSLAAA